MKVSVITPSLNPRQDYLDRVFEALNAQTLPKSEWEYMVVDSGSEPPLRSRLDLSWHPSAKVQEAPYRALVRSRLAGMTESVGRILVFVDDDNVLAPDYLETCFRIMEAHPFLGALGAYCEGEFEVPPQPWMKEFLWILSAGQFAKPRQHLSLEYALSTAGGPYIPAGGGLVLQRAVAQAYCDRVTRDPGMLEIGRIDDALAGSEDTDLVFTAMAAGYAIGKSMELHMTHLIPARRLTLDYLRRLLYASTYSSERLAIRWGWREPEPERPVRPMRRARNWVGRLRTKDPAMQCWGAIAQGRRDARTGRPFDPRFR